MQWKITQLNTYGEGIVCQASWNVSSSDGEFTGSLNGGTAFKLDPDAPFTPYDQLTETQILEWVFSALGEEGKASAEADVLAQIEYAKEQVQSPALPWN